ncbi:hypothetical protein ABZ413_26550, partial [Nocardia rhamnosiphila]|uniref:hypothetical protein n=1 Tax=Nocardia rhamnosiphila TaxID=426716 RepID=UPI0033E5A37B
TVRLCSVRLCSVRLCSVRLCSVRLCSVRLCSVRLCSVSPPGVGAWACLRYRSWCEPEEFVHQIFQ